jgi:hypothetical protein
MKPAVVRLSGKSYKDDLAAILYWNRMANKKPSAACKKWDCASGKLLQIANGGLTAYKKSTICQITYAYSCTGRQGMNNVFLLSGNIREAGIVKISKAAPAYNIDVNSAFPVVHIIYFKHIAVAIDVECDPVTFVGNGRKGYFP